MIGKMIAPDRLRWPNLLRRGWLYWLLLNYPFTLLAQTPPIKFEHLGTEQGLSQSTVYCILQDHQGFLWFGTQAGLNKYDGYNFTAYRQDVFDSTSLSQDVAWAMYEDHTGTLWAGGPNAACLNRFEPDKERFTRFVHDPKNPNSLSAAGLNVIYEDHFGTLWVGTFNGLNKFDREKEQFTRYLYDPQAPNSLHGYAVFSIYEDRSGTLWIGTERWLNKFDREKEQFIHYEHDPHHSPNLIPRPITAILEDRIGTLWVGSEGAGLKKFDRASGQFTHFFHDPKNPHSLSSDSVRAIYEDRYGKLWIGTWSGLDQFDRDQERFTRFVHDPKNPFSLSDNIIWSIYEDSASRNILWVGTYNGGVNKLDRGKEQFAKIVSEPDNPHSLSHNGVRSFYQDHTGALWVGTQNGLNRFDRNTRQFTCFFHDPKNPNSLGNNTVCAIYEDRRGMLWIGTNKGLDKLDPVTKRFTHFLYNPKNPNSLSNDRIRVIYEDRYGALWIGTFGGGLNRFDREKEQFTRFVPDPENPHSIRGGYVWAICEDSLARNILWVAASGVNRLDRDTGRFTHFVHDPKNPHSLSHDYVGALWIDHSGTLWVGTIGGGLDRFDHDAEQFTPFTTKDGLCDNQVCGILEDDRGRLWLSTANGLSRFDPQIITFRNYDVTDGLANNEFWIGGQYQSYDGEMFLASSSGFSAFHPDSIKDNPYIPPVVISAFKRYNTDEAEGVGIVEKGISAKKAIEVFYKDNILNFEFAALSYRNTFRNQYAYKLEGYSDQWIQLGTERRVSFTNLDPGEYTLRVKGSNNDGVWNEEGTSLKITVTPPWWKTSWAYLLYVLLFTGLLYGFRRYELNRVHLKNQLKLEKVEAEKIKELDHLKSRFFANISHEFRTPLTLILGQLDSAIPTISYEKTKNKLQMAFRNARQLLRLINQLLDLSKLEAGSMALKAAHANLIPFLKNLVFSFESLAEQKRIALQFHTTHEDLEIYFEPEKLEKVFYNLLSNAFKFTPEGGRIEVAVGRSSDRNSSSGSSTGRPTATDFVHVSIKDTGVGIPANELPRIFDRFYQVDGSHTREHEGTGIGLALAKELVELHHGEITVKSAVGVGTEFVVKLPLGAQHLKTNEMIEETAPLVAESDYLTRPSEELFVAATAPPATATTTATATATELLLVVEDNADVRSYVREHLEEHYKIIEAANGEEGLAKAQETIPDLIITDVMMPKMDGFEFSRMLRNDEKTSHIPIIMLTAKASLESKIEGLETGVDDYLTKPFSPKELLARVRNLITLRQQLRERFSRATIIKPSEVSAVSVDQVFLQRVLSAIEANLGEEKFGVENLAEKVHMSVSQLNRKLNGLIDQPAGQLLRSMRLQRAADLLEQNAGTVAEIAYQVGFGSQAHFTTTFQKLFGCTPSEYRKARGDG